MIRKSGKTAAILLVLSAMLLCSGKSVNVDETIKTVGPTKPDWYAKTSLNYPKTLDLAGTRRQKGWRPTVNLGAYKWDRLNTNPARWKEAIRLLHHVVDVRKNDRGRQVEAMNMLAESYSVYMHDYARAAYWWIKAMKSGAKPSIHALTGIAECYWKLGSKEKAMALLKHYQMTTNYAHKRTCKLLSEMGEHETAIKLAKTLARSRKSGYIAVAHAYRAAGKLDEALKYYKKVRDLKLNPKSYKLVTQCAIENIKGLELFDKIDVKHIPNGAYTGTALSYRGPLTVRVTVASGKITAVDVIRARDDRYFLEVAKREAPGRIIKAQDLSKVDAVSGATISANAILNATANALYSRRK